MVEIYMLVAASYFHPALATTIEEEYSQKATISTVISLMKAKVHAAISYRQMGEARAAVALNIVVDYIFSQNFFNSYASISSTVQVKNVFIIFRFVASCHR